MKNSKLAAVILMTVLWSWWSAVTEAATPDVVLRWAPVMKQQQNNSDAISDVCTLVNYDQDWRSNNNWYNVRFFSLTMAMYYSVVESETHYYLGYYQYYPRFLGGSAYENDMTGILAVVRKGSNGPEFLEVLLTYSNGKWRKWDGNSHPTVSISPGTHEITLLTANSNKSRSGKADCSYQLVSLDELWSRRQDIGKNHTFGRWGYFDSNFSPGTPVPWVWDYQRFNWLSQPGELTQSMQGVSVTPVKYLNNPYQPWQR